MNEQTQTLQVRDTQTGQDVQSTKIISKDKTEKWRIKTDKGYKYITQKEIDTYQLRKEIGERPKDELQYRNNVEATIFQLGYHYPDAKSRYRGLPKHQMWANMRCLWVNFVRIANFVIENGQNMPNIALNFIKTAILFHIAHQILASVVQDLTSLTRRPKSAIL